MNPARRRYASFNEIVWNTWQPEQRATLVFVIKHGRVLLIHKKRGLGAGKINGPGGRIDPGESELACAIREAQEELHITPTGLVPSGELFFQFTDGLSIHVTVFKASGYIGEPEETEEAAPLWVSLDEIPYDQMWADDRLWLPLMLEGKKFVGRFLFDEDALLQHELESETHPRQLLVLATRNRDKVIEMREALKEMPIEILTLDSFPDAPEVVEDGDTLEANAHKKAWMIHTHTGLPALADDTGLFVAALEGAPGVYSNRYAGEGASYRDNVQKLLAAMQHVRERTAEFRSVIAFAVEGEVHFIKGACAGRIGHAPQGAGAFGYDPVFIATATNRTFAEMSLAEKNVVSHRGHALAAFRDFVREMWSL